MSLGPDGVIYAAPPPPGVIPDWNRAYDAQGLIVSIVVLLSLAVSLTILRFATRVFISRDHRADDVVMEIATVLSVVLSALILDLLNYGLGRHLWDIPINVLYPRFMLENLLCAITFCAASALSKISILLFYCRIFQDRKLLWIVWSIITFTGGYGLATMLAALFSCSPVQASWNLKYAATAKCINRPVSYFAQAGLGIVADIATLIVPLPVIWKLKMPKQQKAGVFGLLTVGTFVCIVSVIRFKSLKGILDSDDITRATVNGLMWCVLELNVSIIGGCIPAIKPFLKRFVPVFIGSSVKQSCNSQGLSSFQKSKTESANLDGSKAASKTHIGVQKEKADDADSLEDLSRRYIANRLLETEDEGINIRRKSALSGI